MKITRYIVALLFAVPLTAWALEEAPGSGNWSEEEISDIRVECISNAVAEELEDDQQDVFVENCVNQARLARNAGGSDQD